MKEILSERHAVMGSSSHQKGSDIALMSHEVAFFGSNFWVAIFFVEFLFSSWNDSSNNYHVFLELVLFLERTG